MSNRNMQIKLYFALPQVLKRASFSSFFSIVLLSSCFDSDIKIITFITTVAVSVVTVVLCVAYWHAD